MTLSAGNGGGISGPFLGSLELVFNAYLPGVSTLAATKSVVVHLPP